jgi:glutamate carboxypeptidase
VHPFLRHTATDITYLRDALDAFIRAESPSTDKAAVDRCGNEIARRLEQLGATVERIHQREHGDHIRAVLRGSGPRLMLLGHFDTVWPLGQIARMPVREDDGRLYGPGVFDMKSGIAAALTAVRALEALRVPRPEVVVLLTTDEEIGSGTSRTLIEQEARGCQAVLVLEPSLPGGGAKTSRKGVGEFEVIIHGRASHAGLAPEQGANAVHEAAHQILALQALQDLARGVSVNVTMIEGGTRVNVIPDRARLRVDVRVSTLADARDVEGAVRGRAPQVAGTRLEVHGGIDRPPMERGPQVLRMYELARECAAELGQTLAEGGAGGGSDGNFTAAVGVPTIDGLGPQGDGAHALHEHVLVADLPWRAAFLASLIGRFAGSDRVVVNEVK